MKDLLSLFRSKQLQLEKEIVHDTQCPFCSVQCKMQVIEKQSGSHASYKSVPVFNPASEGRLCIKGRYAHQHTTSIERVKSPLLKVEGGFVPIEWEEALDMIKERFTAIGRQDGADAIGVYGGGSLTNEEAYLLGKFARVALQTRHIDYNGRFCMSAAATAANQAFGMDRGLTNPLSDISEAKCIILAGTNLAECQPTLMPYFMKAKKEGAFIIVIDPRETLTAKMADLHLKVKPGMDATLVNGLLKVIIDEGYENPRFIEDRTKGYEKLKNYLSSISLKDIEILTGIPLSRIRLAATAFGRAETGMIFTARGVEQQTHGTMTVRNFMNLLLITGKIGKKGCGYGAVTGQGNGQGGREHGQKSDQLPGYRSIENQADRSYIAKVWGIEESELPGKGVSAYEMIEKIDKGEITGLFIMGSNPVVSNPNANFVERALKKCKFIVAADLFLSETARIADLILPSTSFLEDEGTMTNVEGRVTQRPASKKPPRLAKHDWQILCEIARVLGKRRYFNYSSVEEIFNELRIASHGGIADYYGITYNRLKEEGGVYWPCPSVHNEGAARLFETSFAHKDGKAELIDVDHYGPLEPVSAKYPLHLTTGRVMSQYLTGVQTSRSQNLTAFYPDAYLEIHPETAQLYNIEDESFVEVETARGRIVVKSKLSNDIREDTVFIPMHGGGRNCVNNLTHPALDPYCKMPGFKVCAVKVRPINK